MDVLKTVHMNELFDFYGQLLTERQRAVFRRYYHEDLSLAEIGEEFDISRQAVHDVLRRCEQTLQQLESKLGLVARHRRQQALLARLEAELTRLAAAVGHEAVAPLAEPLDAWRRELGLDPGDAGSEP